MWNVTTAMLRRCIAGPTPSRSPLTRETERPRRVEELWDEPMFLEWRSRRRIEDEGGPSGMTAACDYCVGSSRSRISSRWLRLTTTMLPSTMRPSCTSSCPESAEYIAVV